jgi:hypothetical protein
MSRHARESDFVPARVSVLTATADDVAEMAVAPAKG